MKKFFVILSIIFCIMLFAEDDFLSKMKKHYQEFDEKVNALQIEEIMTIDQGGQSMIMNIEIFQKNEKSRINIKLESKDIPEVESVVLNDGKDAYLITSFTGTEKLSKEDAQQYDFVNDFLWWNMLSDDFKEIKEEKIDDINCKVMRIDYDDAGLEYDLIWINPKNYSLIRAESVVEDNTIVIKMGDYHKVLDEYEIPYSMDIYTDGELTTSIKIEDFKVNKKIDDKIFDLNNIDIKVNESLKNLIEGLQKGE